MPTPPARCRCTRRPNSAELELGDDRRRAERHVVAAADVDRRPGERLAAGRAADVVARLEHERRAARPGQVGGGDQAVVAGADDDHVVVRLTMYILDAMSTPTPRPSPCSRGGRARSRRQHRRDPGRRDRAARPAPAAQHRPARRRRGGRPRRWPASATSSTSGCCRRSPTPSPTSTPGRPGRSGCRRPRCSPCSTTSAGASPLTAARKVVFLNGHGGNSALLGVANRELRLDHGLMTFLAHPGVPPDQGGLSAEHELGMGVHGGHDETSLMLHLAPELVDMTAARRARSRSTSPPTATSASAARCRSAGCPTTSPTPA